MRAGLAIGAPEPLRAGPGPLAGRARRSAARSWPAATCQLPGCRRRAACRTSPACLGRRPRAALRLEAQVDGEHRLLEHVAAVLADHGVDQPEPLQRPAVLRQLLGGRATLHRHQGAAGLEQRHAPAGQLVEPGHGAGRHERRRHACRRAPRPAPGARSRCRARAPRPRPTATGAAQHRLDEVHLEVRPHDRQGDARAGRPRTRRRPAARPAGKASATTAQLSTCRSHSRGTSRGPISPWRDPGVGEDLGEPDRERHPRHQTPQPHPKVRLAVRPEASSGPSCFT